MKCVDTMEMTLFLEGTLEPERTAAIDAHLDSCEECGSLKTELAQVTGRLAPDEGEFDDEELAPDVMTLIRLGQEPRMAQDDSGPSTAHVLIPAALLALAAAAALTIALPGLLTDQAPKPTQTHNGFAARGGGDSEARWASIEIFRSTRGSYTPVEKEIIRDDALAIAYENRDENPFSYLMIFAQDDEGTVFWYYPAHETDGENPVSLSIRRTDKPVQLPDAVTHELREGPLKITALFSHEPFDVVSIEKALGEASAPGGTGELQIEGTVSQEFELQVVDSPSRSNE